MTQLIQRITSDKNPDCPLRCQHVSIFPRPPKRIKGRLIREARQCQEAAEKGSPFCGEHQ